MCLWIYLEMFRLAQFSFKFVSSQSYFCFCFWGTWKNQSILYMLSFFFFLSGYKGIEILLFVNLKNKRILTHTMRSVWLDHKMILWNYWILQGLTLLRGQEWQVEGVVFALPRVVSLMGSSCLMRGFRTHLVRFTCASGTLCFQTAVPWLCQHLYCLSSEIP